MIATALLASSHGVVLCLNSGKKSRRRFLTYGLLSYNWFYWRKSKVPHAKVAFFGQILQRILQLLPTPYPPPPSHISIDASTGRGFYVHGYKYIIQITAALLSLRLIADRKQAGVRACVQERLA